MTCEIEMILGGKIERERKIPGSILIEGKEFLYFSDNGTGKFEKQFFALAGHIKPTHQKHGGIISQACRITPPGGPTFHGISYRGDIEGARRQIQEGASALGILLGKIEGDRFSISDGRSFDLSECTVKFG